MSLPMPSGSCWTKRTTESNRTAPEILRGFFCAIPASGRIIPQNSPTPPNPLTFPPHRRRPTRPSRPARYLPRLPAPPFPHSSPAPLTYIKIPEADRLRDFLLYQAQCDSHHSGGSDEHSRGKGLFAQAQACQLSQEQRTQDCGGNGVSTAAGEYRIGAEPHTRRQDQPGQTGLDALERCRTAG